MTMRASETPAIRMTGVVKTFGAVVANRDAFLDVATGEIHALVGENGAGKSTLLSLGATALMPKSGKVSLNELDSRDQQTQFRKRVAWMPQQYRAVPGLTVREQVAYSGWLKGMSRDDSWRGASEALARVALQDLADRPASELSGGQQQRVAVARALASKPKFILADEPTANLDSTATNQLLDIMEQLNKEEHITFIFATHDQRVMDKARRVVSLDDGKVISDVVKS